MPRRARPEQAPLGARAREVASQTAIFRYPPAWRPIVALMPPPGKAIVGIEADPNVIGMETCMRQHIVWPATADRGGISAAARAVSTQVGPLAIDYHQWRAHVSRHLSELDIWLCNLGQELKNFDDHSNGIMALQREVQTLRAHVELLTHLTLDQARATPAATEQPQSMFDRIRQAQRIAARSRGSSPARSYSSEPLREV